MIRIESAVIPEPVKTESQCQSTNNGVVQRADRSRSHVNQDDNGEAPCGTPQPSLVKERSGLHQVKDDKQGQGNDEDLSHVEKHFDQLGCLM